MTETAKKAALFRSLHKPAAPLVLYNVWDAGGAKSLVDAGAPAVATGSASVAWAHGYDDGEEVPLELVLTVASRIAASVDAPVTIDFEGAYAAEPDGVEANVARLAATGVVGMNFEDQVVGGEGLHPIETQAARIGAARRGAGEDFFVNARTDLFLKSKPEEHAGLVGAALERAAAYAEAGADGFFVPLLTSPDLVAEVAERSPLRINVMARGDMASPAAAAKLGVARVSYGPAPYLAAMKDLAAAYSTARDA
ncbi:MAG: isocitrate lyase/phosphoenolpyruvate mutase family protein [Pseudomonadota bacterium]